MKSKGQNNYAERNSTEKVNCLFAGNHIHWQIHGNFGTTTISVP